MFDVCADAPMYVYATEAMKRWISDLSVPDMVVIEAVRLYENYVPWYYEPSHV